MKIIMPILVGRGIVVSRDDEEAHGVVQQVHLRCGRVEHVQASFDDFGIVSFRFEGGDDISPRRRRWAGRVTPARALLLVAIAAASAASFAAGFDAACLCLAGFMIGFVLSCGLRRWVRS